MFKCMQNALPKCTRSSDIPIRIGIISVALFNNLYQSVSPNIKTKYKVFRSLVPIASIDLSHEWIRLLNLLFSVHAFFFSLSNDDSILQSIALNQNVAIAWVHKQLM